MDKKEELLAELDNRKNQYSKIHVKGALFLTESQYYPIKLLFLPVKDTQKEYAPKDLNYGDLVLIEDWINADELSEYIKKLGNDVGLTILSYQVKIPNGEFMPLDESVTKLLRETRSFPSSNYRQWPSKVYLFQFKSDNLNRTYNKKVWEYVPLKENLPVFPYYRDALTGWLGREALFVNDWTLIFYLPDFSARIKNIKFGKDGSVIDVEEGILSINRLKGKYYVEYENFSSSMGEIDFMEKNKVPIENKVQRFYFVLYDKEQPSMKIDYRDHNWRHPYGDSESLDVEFEYEKEEEEIEYLLTNGEDETTEFKLTINDQDPKEFLETVASFSNTSGGIILIGVDNSGNIKGLDKNQITRYQQKIPDLIREWIEPSVQAKIEVVDVRERQIIKVLILKGKSWLYNYKNYGIYIRANATDRIATRSELLSLIPPSEFRHSNL